MNCGNYDSSDFCSYPQYGRDVGKVKGTQRISKKYYYDCYYYKIFTHFFCSKLERVSSLPSNFFKLRRSLPFGLHSSLIHEILITIIILLLLLFLRKRRKKNPLSLFCFCFWPRYFCLILKSSFSGLSLKNFLDIWLLLVIALPTSNWFKTK